MLRLLYWPSKWERVANKGRAVNILKISKKRNKIRFAGWTPFLRVQIDKNAVACTLRSHIAVSLLRFLGDQSLQEKIDANRSLCK